MKSDDHLREEQIAFLLQELKSKLVSGKSSCAMIVVRLARDCPFRDVREAFAELVEQLGLAEKEKQVSVSRFMLAEQVQSIAEITAKHPELQNWLEDVFLISGRISHLDRMLCMLPKFYPIFATCLNQVMRENGPLPVHYRHYLAVIASARYKCRYLINLHEIEFLRAGGDSKWLKGIENLPEKMQAILHFNACLAHQPWRLNSATIQTLVENNGSWSLSELVHAVVILSTFHMLSGLVHGLGINSDADLKSSLDDAFDINLVTDSNMLADCANENIIEVLSSNVETLHPDGVNTSSTAKQLEEVESEANISASSDERLSQSSPSAPKRQTSWLLNNFPPEMGYEDFFSKRDKKDRKEFKVHRLEDYNWKNHGYYLLSRFYPDGARVLDEEFDFIYEMTGNYIYNEQGVDTGPFRRAIWNYAHFLYGIVSDAYNYQKVNVLLNMNIKSFIKKVVCNPLCVTYRDFHQIGYILRPEEKVHVALLALESRRRASLLYALHAIMVQRKL
jgi:sestrin